MSNGHHPSLHLAFNNSYFTHVNTVSSRHTHTILTTRNDSYPPPNLDTNPVSTAHYLSSGSGSLPPTHNRRLPSFSPATAMPFKDAYDTPRGRLTRIGAWELGHTLGRGAYGKLAPTDPLANFSPRPNRHSCPDTRTGRVQDSSRPTLGPEHYC